MCSSPELGQSCRIGGSQCQKITGVGGEGTPWSSAICPHRFPLKGSLPPCYHGRPDLRTPRRPYRYFATQGEGILSFEATRRPMCMASSHSLGANCSLLPVSLEKSLAWRRIPVFPGSALNYPSPFELLRLSSPKRLGCLNTTCLSVEMGRGIHRVKIINIWILSSYYLLMLHSSHSTWSHENPSVLFQVYCG